MTITKEGLIKIKDVKNIVDKITKKKIAEIKAYFKLMKKKDVLKRIDIREQTVMFCIPISINKRITEQLEKRK